MTRSSPRFREIAILALRTFYRDNWIVLGVGSVFLTVVVFGLVTRYYLAPLSGTNKNVCMAWLDKREEIPIFRNGCWMWNIGHILVFLVLWSFLGFVIICFVSICLLVIFGLIHTWVLKYWNDAKKRIIDESDQKASGREKVNVD